MVDWKCRQQLRNEDCRRKCNAAVTWKIVLFARGCVAHSFVIALDESGLCFVVIAFFQFGQHTVVYTVDISVNNETRRTVVTNIVITRRFVQFGSGAQEGIDLRLKVMIVPIVRVRSTERWNRPIKCSAKFRKKKMFVPWWRLI